MGVWIFDFGFLLRDSQQCPGCCLGFSYLIGFTAAFSFGSWVRRVRSLMYGGPIIAVLILDCQPLF